MSISEQLASNFSGPLLFSYVWWILKIAKERGICKLYFLSRDGYLLQRIAKQFCSAFGLQIECRYLYCSRASLRMPSYHLIGEEAYDLLFQYGYQVTLHSVLKRCFFSDIEEENVRRNCGLEDWDSERLLNTTELAFIRKKMTSSVYFRDLLEKKSKIAYENAIGYLRQEGFFSEKIVAIVDSGWTGSIQRSMRQLLKSEGFNGQLVGFYFGLYVRPRSEDGEYITWHFNWDGKLLDKICFCNNLFECLLSAPHGMTVGYRNEAGRYIPVLGLMQNSDEQRKIQHQINAILDATDQCINKIEFEGFNYTREKRHASKLCCRYMTHPTRAEACYYGGFLFCDDITEAYQLRLAESDQTETLKEYFLPVRFMHRLLHRPRKTAELLWPYGTNSFFRGWRHFCLQWSIYCWQWLKYIRKKS